MIRIEWICRDGFGWYSLIDNLVHKGTVRAIFQKPTHQISKKIAVRTNGRVNPTARRILGQNDIVQGLAHPMQSLKFIGLGRRSKSQNSSDRVGIVRCELRIDPVG